MKTSKQNKLFRKAEDGSANIKTAYAFLTIGIALMMTIGISMARQTQEQVVINSMNDKISVATEEKPVVSDGCHCHQIPLGTDGDIKTTHIEIDLCQYLNDGYDDAMALIDDTALTDWCYGGFTSQQSQNEQQQSTPQNNDISPVERFLNFLQTGGSDGGNTPPNEFINPVSQASDGLNGNMFQNDAFDATQGTSVQPTHEWTSTETTREEVRALAQSMHDWCNNGDNSSPPPLDPGNWKLGEAMARCFVDVMAAYAVPYTIIATIIWFPFLRICISADVYLRLNHLLNEYNVDISEIYWSCVKYLTGEDI